MTGGKDDIPGPPLLGAAIIDHAIRLALLGLLAYSSLKLVGPFLTIVLWSAVLTVALYPLFDRLARWIGGRRRLAAVIVTLLCLTIVIGPVSWLGFSLIAGVGSVVAKIDAGLLSIPPPGESIRDWPLIGEHVHQLWSLAATNVKAVLVDFAPQLKSVGGSVLKAAQGVGLGVLQFVAAVVIAGFLFSPGPYLVDALEAFARRVVTGRGEEMVQLAGATIRNVSRGVIGIALLQSLLAGIGLLAAGVPAAGFLTFLALLLGIVQIGPGILLSAIVVWSWMTMEAMTALIFTVYMVPVGLVDNALRPIVMARGLTTPMPVVLIGVIGGTIAHGNHRAVSWTDRVIGCMGASGRLGAGGRYHRHDEPDLTSRATVMTAERN
jgi:predicted PurR-regulated permease PerM